MDKRDQSTAALSGRFVQRGAATAAVAYDGAPKAFYFVLLSKLTMLALASAIEPLRIANQIARKELFNWFTLTADGQPVVCSNAVQVGADGGLTDVPRGAMIFVCGGVDPHQTLDPKVTNWLRRQHRSGAHVGGLCTGAFTLAKAGMLTNKRFTLHWENHTSFIESFPDLLPTKTLFEVDGNLLTAAGGSASTDMMLQLIERDFGHGFANMVSDMCLHGRSQTGTAHQKSSYSAAIESRHPTLVAAVGLMQENLEEPLTLEEVSKLSNVSRRQLERSFKAHLGQSPRTYYTDLRLARAYALLGETNMTVADVAAATGFNSPSILSKLFRQKFDISPSRFRKSWSTSQQENGTPEAPQ